MPTVTVVIPTYNARDRLARCLSALQAQTRTPDEVLVVDNASNDGTAPFVCNHFPAATVLPQATNRGGPGGLNAGVERARGDMIAALDSDAYATPTWLEALLAALDGRPEFAIASSRLLSADGSDRIDSVGQGFAPHTGAVMIGNGQPNGPAFDQPREVFAASNAAALYRREVFERVGPLDESVFMYGGDMDFGFRARLLGYRCLYGPEAIVHHQGSATIGRNTPRQMRLMFRNGLAVYWKNTPWPIIRATWPQTARLLAGMLRHAPHRGSALQGVLDALWRLPETLRKRRIVQRTRTVEIDALWRAMAPEGLPLDGPSEETPRQP